MFTNYGARIYDFDEAARIASEQGTWLDALMTEHHGRPSLTDAHGYPYPHRGYTSFEPVRCETGMERLIRLLRWRTAATYEAFVLGITRPREVRIKWWLTRAHYERYRIEPIVMRTIWELGIDIAQGAPRCLMHDDCAETWALGYECWRASRCRA